MSKSKRTSNGRQDYPESAADKAHRRHIRRYQNQGNWFIFFRAYLQIMSRLEALLLQDLENLIACAEDRGELDEEEFSKCTKKYLTQYGCKWSMQEQRTHIGKLEDRGFIETKVVKTRRGIARYIRINLIEIEAALDAAKLAKQQQLAHDRSLIDN